QCRFCAYCSCNAAHVIRHERIHTGEKPFGCDVCQKAFAHKFDLKVHKRVHTGEKPYSCQTCQRAFSTRCRLIGHERIHTEEKPYILVRRCAPRQRMYLPPQSKEIGDTHTQAADTFLSLPPLCHSLILRDSIIIIFFTSSCPTVTEEVLPTLMNENADTESCGRKAPSSLHLGGRCYNSVVVKRGKPNFLINGLMGRIHETVHSDEKPYRCQTCQRAFSRRTYLVSHERLHTGEKPYKCSTCGTAFRPRDSLKGHERLHTGQRPYRSAPDYDAYKGDAIVPGSLSLPTQRVFGERAGITLPRVRRIIRDVPHNTNAAQHFKNNTGRPLHRGEGRGCSYRKGPLKAESCSFDSENIHSSRNDDSEMQQQKVDHRQDRHQCRFCLYFSCKAANVIRHERTHTGEKPFGCCVCQKAFAHKSDLKVHKRVHTGEKPYRCQTCQRAFSTRSRLVGHERIHTGEKPYKCSTCGTAFRHRDSLKGHERLHKGQRPYRCEICGSAFAQSGHLTLHQKRHT
ncbi:unnamed protein product, partial [Ixodes hexagonus]